MSYCKDGKVERKKDMIKKTFSRINVFIYLLAPTSDGFELEGNSFAEG